MGSDENSPEYRFGQNVRAEREARGWTQADLAAQLRAAGLNLHPSAIAKIELRKPKSGQPRTIRLDEAAVIADVLAVPLWKMLGGSPLTELQSQLVHAINVIQDDFTETDGVLAEVTNYIASLDSEAKEQAWRSPPGVVVAAVTDVIEAARSELYAITSVLDPSRGPLSELASQVIGRFRELTDVRRQEWEENFEQYRDLTEYRSGQGEDHADT